MEIPAGAAPIPELLPLFARFTRQLVEDYVLTDALHDLIEDTVGLLGIAGAGVSVALDGSLKFVTAANDRVDALERVQDREQEGPCVDAHRAGIAVLVPDIGKEDRWPALTAAATGAGLHAMAGIPMHLNGTRFGALNLYDASPHAWSGDQIEIAELVAQMATAYVANAARLDRVRHTTEQLQEALDSRVIIEQAKGILAGEGGISIDEAFGILRSHARNNHLSLRDVAHAVVNLRLRP